MSGWPAGLRRAVALALLVAALAGVGLLAWLPWRWIEAQDARLAALEQRIAALRERLAEREQLQAERRLLEEALGDETLFVRAPTPALAAAELQGLVSAAVRAGGGELSSVQVLEPTEVPPFTEIGLRLTMRADLDGLVAILHAIESSRPLLLLRALQLSAASVESEGPVPLETVVELVALARRG